MPVSGATADFPMKKEASFENWIGQAENNPRY
jgi:hypothetical protein